MAESVPVRPSVLGGGGARSTRPSSTSHTSQLQHTTSVNFCIFLETTGMIWQSLILRPRFHCFFVDAGVCTFQVALQGRMGPTTGLRASRLSQDRGPTTQADNPTPDSSEAHSCSSLIFSDTLAVGNCLWPIRGHHSHLQTMIELHAATGSMPAGKGCPTERQAQHDVPSCPVSVSRAVRMAWFCLVCVAGRTRFHQLSL